MFQDYYDDSSDDIGITAEPTEEEVKVNSLLKYFKAHFKYISFEHIKKYIKSENRSFNQHRLAKKYWVKLLNILLDLLTNSEQPVLI